MFRRIIFVCYIVSTLSCKFNRCADCFQSFSKQRFPEYSKCRALNRFKITNKHNKFFIMLERNSVNVHSNTRHCLHCKSQNRLAGGAKVQVTGHRSGYRSQATGQVTGQITDHTQKQ